MKKILLALTAAVIITSSASGVVSCGFREPTNVILEIQTNVAKPDSQIVKAYQKIVNDYNHDRADNPVKVEVRTTPANNIDNEIASGQPLPNLYVAYGDSSTKYETILNQIEEGDKIVNLAQAVNWDPAYVDSINSTDEPQIAFIKEFRNNGSEGNDLSQGVPLDTITHADSANPQDHFTPLKDSFVREGSNNQEMYVVPTAKSGMNGVMNIRLLNELVSIVTSGAIKLSDQLASETQIREPFFFKTAEITQWIGDKDLPLNQLETPWRLPVSNIYQDSTQTIAALFNQWFAPVNSVVQLQAVMQDLSKLEVIILAYNLLVEFGGNKSYFKSEFSLAFDDVPGLIYTMQANLGFGDQQIYSWTKDQPYNLDLYQSGKNVESLKEVLELFAWGDQLRHLDNDAGNNPDHGYGGITAKLNSGGYYSNTWQNSGMLAYFGSTAGTPFWISNNPEGTQVEDLELMGAPSYTPSAQSFVAQQGPGMGMFKSQNQVKNQIAIDFINYFLKAENNANFAFAAGYIPSNYYAYYANQGSSGIPTDESQMGPYYQRLALEAGDNPPAEVKIKAAKIVKKYVDSLLLDQTQLWTQIPTPFGDAMRFQVLVPWLESNFKTVGVSHRLNFDQFWKDIQNQSSIASVWRVVHGIFPVEGTFKIQQGKELEKIFR